MSSIEKEFVELTGLKRKNFDNEEEYITAILEYCSEEIDEEDLGEMSEEASTWFNANVDAISEEEGELIPFDALNPEDAPFGEDDEEESATEEDEGEEVDGEEVEMKDLESGDKVAIVLAGDEVVEGKVIKVMKVALKIVDANGEETRISSKKIETIYKLAEEEAATEEKEEIAAEETDKAEEKTMEEAICSDEKASPEELKEVEEAIKDGGFVKAIEVAGDLEKKRACKCSGKSKPNNAKEIMYHMSEILRLTADMM